MNLEEVNKKYLELKTKLSETKQEIEELSKKANELSDDKVMAKSEQITAKRNGDKDAEEKATANIEQIDKDLKEVLVEAQNKKIEILRIQSEINEKVESIKNDPEMKEHLDSVMAKKYGRKISELSKEKEELAEKKATIGAIKDLTNEHPTLANNLKGIFTATKEIKDLKAEIDSLSYDMGGGLIGYTDGARVDEIRTKLIPAAESKLLSNKTPFMDYINKNKINITEQQIDELADKGYKADSKGNIDLDATLNKNIKGIDKEIKGLNKTIRNYDIALSSLELGASVRKYTDEEKSEVSHDDGEVLEADYVQIDDEENEKPKWFQFIKRFKNWNEKRHQKLLPESDEKVEEKEETGKAEETGKSDDDKFKSSLKYDIMKDIVNQMEIDNIKEAKKERKEEDKSER